MLCIRYLNTGGIVKILSVDTKPFDNQKPGTGGLRKQTSVFWPLIFQRILFSI